MTSHRELDECEVKRRILREHPHKPEKTLQFVLSLQVERKISKGTELETMHATAEQQEEMEKLLKKNKKE
ncbi:MAG TPA: hypothetical protein VFJ51_12985 [Nitrososphaeraceae archaeon]|nr:hypothetical protein [Nitrososphaeraceae archaeon]